MFRNEISAIDWQNDVDECGDQIYYGRGEVSLTKHSLTKKAKKLLAFVYRS